MKNNSSKHSLRPGQKFKAQPQLTNSTVVRTNMKSYDEFTTTMARLEILDSESYEAFRSKLADDCGFPKYPATYYEIEIESIWEECRITKGYLRLLNALQNPASAFYDVR